MNNKKPLVSIVIPGRMSGSSLQNCLPRIKNQTYTHIEVIVVDSNSTDNTKELVKAYGYHYYNFIPRVKKGQFDATHKRNFGAKKAKGKYIYYVDADMELPPDTVEKTVMAAEKEKYDAAIIPQDSYGTNIWAKAKWLERHCYFGDDSIEAPRFISKKAWDTVDGLDESLGAGGDDWDMTEKLKLNRFRIGRVNNVLVLNNEGNLSLKKLWRKRFMYGRDTLKYLQKRPGAAAKSYFPIRKAYLKNWKLFFKHPIISFAFIIMRSTELLGTLSGIGYSLIIEHV